MVLFSIATYTFLPKKNGSPQSMPPDVPAVPPIGVPPRSLNAELLLRFESRPVELLASAMYIVIVGDTGPSTVPNRLRPCMVALMVTRLAAPRPGVNQPPVSAGMLVLGRKRPLEPLSMKLAAYVTGAIAGALKTVYVAFCDAAVCSVLLKVALASAWKTAWPDVMGLLSAVFMFNTTVPTGPAAPAVVMAGNSRITPLLSVANEATGLDTMLAE